MGRFIDEVRRQVNTDRRRRSISTWFLGICPVIGCGGMQPPVLRTGEQVAGPQELCTRCNTPMVFVMKQGNRVLATRRPGSQYFVYICLRDNTRCGPRFRTNEQPVPVCRHKTPMQLAIRKSA